MGAGNSKSDKKSDKKTPKEDPKAKGTATAKAPKNPETPTEKAPATTTNTATPTSAKPQEKDEDDIHESWNDQVLFARNEGTKAMTKDDFEVIATIGKGSFGKVRKLAILLH
jgi:hypothetical protein